MMAHSRSNSVRAHSVRAKILELVAQLHKQTQHSWTLMEVCGGQTHSILRHGLQELLPPGLRLIHGPGCPVCVTPLSSIDLAHVIALEPNVILCTFGDMLRVPGSKTDLLTLRAQGADIRGLYNTLEAVELAKRLPEKEIVLFAVGFETTAPATALALHHALHQRLKNFTALVAHVRVPPAMRAILSDPQNQVQGFLAAGHVCAVMGTAEYAPLVQQFKVPIIATGFEPDDLLKAILMCVIQLESQKAQLEIQYQRAVKEQGNSCAQDLMRQVFEFCDQEWRGLGVLPNSGLGLKPNFYHLDARRRFNLSSATIQTPETETHQRNCLSGQILTGKLRPPQCPAFGTWCTPAHPLGATMVSDEGACAAYFHFKKDTHI